VSSECGVVRAFRSMKTLDLHIRPIHHHLADRVRAHSFRTLLHELSTIVRNTCTGRLGQHNGATFQMITTRNPVQQRALQLLQSITV